MTTCSGGLPPDLYQVLGVDQAATGEEITRAWRQRARAEHPDARPRDAAAPARFRLLAEAYQVLGDPARRAAYDQAARYPSRPRPVAPRRSARSPQGRIRPPSTDPLTGAPGAPLRAGPVRVEAPGGGPAPRLAPGKEDRLAELVLRFLAGGWERPW